MNDLMDDMEDALRTLETILDDAQDWNAGDLIEHLESAIEALSDAISLVANEQLEEED